ncbi:CoxG family protein [Geodermatophilus obscurus]|uniref:Carbon monoxide dehydrogenase subunit G n=1 Tax=Geodermatophilus obscurus (strain ATCC 25078 / DSM 43160 / JCM 3152 / CCUG 61914 / KCC A-0152 / KCTC 9177 / NBRC 13315 / NRRL B-3577 / G-20) TaxID=526225 RepID=D2S3U6_GEOOG|nr:carbon monoxide dehydrogenase subunit G [Geodermatophilus obscurus]ADB72974.1 carbon monoxide dehydrogenase subunit G [Geodermatophilus obscurus DSM 43160]
MNLDGSAVLHGSPEAVWEALTDPAVLARTIPGCLALERVGEDSYRMDVSVGVGAVKGTYAGEVHLTDQERPKSYVMHASGAGAPGQVRATVTIELAPSEDSSTTLTYSADAVVGGPVAGVGQRMITGVAKRMAAQFFTAVDAELTGVAAPAEPRPSAAAAVSQTDAEAPAAPQPQVFVGHAGVPAGTSGDLRTLALGAAGGSLLTLIGVLVGYRLGRRKG